MAKSNKVAKVIDNNIFPVKSDAWQAKGVAEHGGEGKTGEGVADQRDKP